MRHPIVKFVKAVRKSAGVLIWCGWTMVAKDKDFEGQIFFVQICYEAYNMERISWIVDKACQRVACGKGFSCQNCFKTIRKKSEKKQQHSTTKWMKKSRVFLHALNFWNCNSILARLATQPSSAEEERRRRLDKSNTTDLRFYITNVDYW